MCNCHCGRLGRGSSETPNINVVIIRPEMIMTAVTRINDNSFSFFFLMKIHNTLAGNMNIIKYLIKSTGESQSPVIALRKVSFNGDSPKAAGADTYGS
jgi:hypothetical protein